MGDVEFFERLSEPRPEGSATTSVLARTLNTLRSRRGSVCADTFVSRCQSVRARSFCAKIEKRSQAAPRQKEGQRVAASIYIKMLLSREFIAYLSRQLVKRMTPQIIETTDPNSATEMISHVIEDELQVEDRLNDEVRELLSQYSDYMRREGVSYQEMFRRIKNTLISQRKVIRASGRDTHDAMKLSRDKVSEISHKVVEMLRKSRELRLKDKNTNNVRLEIVRVMTDLLQAEDKVDQAARAKIRTQKREIPEGSEEWDLLHRRYYSEELKKLGIDLARS